MDQMTWGALAVVLTLLGGAYTWWAFRRRGVAAGTRGLALTLLVPAAWATGTLRMFTRIVDAIVAWASGLVFSPQVWLGVVLAGVSVVLLGASRFLGDGGAKDDTAAARGSATRTPLPGGTAGSGATGSAASTGARDAAIDDEMAEIEAILRQRGIS